MAAIFLAMISASRAWDALLVLGLLGALLATALYVRAGLQAEPHSP
jgi:hypothetical protein